MKLKVISLILVLGVILGACSTSFKPEQIEGKTVTFTDDLGRSVTVTEPKRVAALLGSYAQVWELAGGTVCASADDAWDDFHLNLPEDAVNLGNTKKLSLEKLLAAEPDFVIASTKTKQHMEWKETLESAGIPTAYFEVANFDDYLRLLKQCTEITGQTHRYEQYGIGVQSEIDQVIERSRNRLEDGHGPKVLSLRASAASIRAKNSRGNILGEILADLGCVNIADSDESLLENLSMEHILKADPEYIFIVQQGDDKEGMEEKLDQFMAENPAWSELSAVSNDRVFFVEKSLFGLKPNNRWGEAYEAVEEILSNE